MKYLNYIAALVLAHTLNAGLCQETKLHPRIELRLMTVAWSSITQSTSFKAELLESGRLQITIPRLSFSGDPTSLYHLDRLLDKCGMVVLTIELPNVDDTAPVFSCLQDLGPVQVCTILTFDKIELSQEAVLSNVKYHTDKLVTFNLDLFNDTAGNISPLIRTKGLLEVELCGMDIALLDVPRR